MAESVVPFRFLAHMQQSQVLLSVSLTHSFFSDRDWCPCLDKRRPSHFDSLSFTLEPVMVNMGVTFLAGYHICGSEMLAVFINVIGST